MSSKLLKEPEAHLGPFSHNTSFTDRRQTDRRQLDRPCHRADRKRDQSKNRRPPTSSHGLSGVSSGYTFNWSRVETCKRPRSM